MPLTHVGWSALAVLLSAAVVSQEPCGRTESRADQPPRKVIVATAIFGPYGKYPGLPARLKQLGSIVDDMAAQAKTKYSGRRSRPGNLARMGPHLDHWFDRGTRHSPGWTSQDGPVCSGTQAPDLSPGRSGHG